MIGLPSRSDMIRAVFDDLDSRQLEILAQLSAARRLEIMFELIEFLRQKTYAAEKQRNPQASEDELWQRVRRRIELGYAPPILQRIRAFDH